MIYYLSCYPKKIIVFFQDYLAFTETLKVYGSFSGSQFSAILYYCCCTELDAYSSEISKGFNKMRLFEFIYRIRKKLLIAKSMITKQMSEK